MVSTLAVPSSAPGSPGFGKDGPGFRGSPKLDPHGEPTRRFLQRPPPPVRPPSGGLVALGSRGVGARSGDGPADPAQHRLRVMPLVPRDGERIVREPGGGGVHQRPFRANQGGSRAASRPGPSVHDGHAADERGRGWLALDGLPHPRRTPVLHGHLFPTRTATGAPVIHAGPAGPGRHLEKQPANLDHGRGCGGRTSGGPLRGASDGRRPRGPRGRRGAVSRPTARRSPPTST
mgnify:CR=1 FL=1